MYSIAKSCFHFQKSISLNARDKHLLAAVSVFSKQKLAFGWQNFVCNIVWTESLNRVTIAIINTLIQCRNQDTSSNITTFKYSNKLELFKKEEKWQERLMQIKVSGMYVLWICQVQVVMGRVFPCHLFCSKAVPSLRLFSISDFNHTCEA